MVPEKLLMKFRGSVADILNSYSKARKAPLFGSFLIFAVIGIHLTTIVVSAGAFPNPPSSLTVTTVSSSSLALRWVDNSTDESSFQIERCQGATCTNFALLRQVATNTITLTDTGLLAGTTYRYRIAALGKNQRLSPYSNIGAGTTATLAIALPAPPSNLSATAISSSQINLVWTDNSNNESGFSCERATSSTGPWTQIGTTSANITSLANGALSAATTYYYRVRASNSAGYSSYTNVAWATTQSGTSTPPAAPTANAGTNVTGSGFTANWTSASGATGYQLDVSTNSAFSTYVAGYQSLNVGNVLSRSMSGLSASTTYYYRVRAYNAYGTSGNSNTASATTTAASDTSAPTVPGNLTATAVSSSQINLSWTASTDTGGSGLAGYKVYQSGTLTGSTATTSYSRTGLTANIQYCYTVAAYDNAGNVSGQSVQACATTQGTTSSQPWSKGFGSTTGDAGQAVAFDSQGNLVMTGYFQGTVDFGCGALTSNGSSYPDIVLAKYSTTGACLWAKRFGGTLDDKGQGVTVDANDNVIVTGYFGGTADFGGGSVVGQRGYNVFVAKYAANGTYQWAKSYGNSLGGENKANAIAADSTGNIALTGTFQNAIDFGGGSITATGSYYNIFVAKLTAAGGQVWAKGFGSLDGTNNYGQGIALDASSNVVVTGYFQGSIDFGGGSLTAPGSGNDIFVAKYGPSGSHLWSKRFGDTANQEAWATVVDTTGNVFITGTFKSTVDFGGGPISSNGLLYPDAFLTKLSSAGQYMWAKSFSSPSSDVGRGLAVDSNNNIFVTGYSLGSVDFGGGSLLSNGQNTFLAKYSTTGAYLFSRNYPGTNFGIGVTTDRNGNVGVTGWYQGSADFGNGTLTNAGSLDGFMFTVKP